MYIGSSFKIAYRYIAKKDTIHRKMHRWTSDGYFDGGGKWDIRSGPVDCGVLGTGMHPYWLRKHVLESLNFGVESAESL